MPFEHFKMYGIGFSVSLSGSEAVQYFISVSLLVWKKKKIQDVSAVVSYL